MRLTSCVPLAGRGVVARSGDLVAVTGGPGPLLDILAETSARAGDGGSLVILAARAALGAGPRAAWACAGATADGGLAVLVHGRAAATVRVDDGPEVTLTAGDTNLPVSRTFTGATVTAILVTGGAEPPDERCWLGDGAVPGGGLAVTASASRAAASGPGPRAQDWDLPTIDTPAAGSAAAGSRAAGAAEAAGAPGEVMVEGALCAAGHFNYPGAWSCRQCGAGMEQPPRHLEWQPRPLLGALVLDDGTRFALDGDYVLGREPTLDGEVLAGRTRPLRINDPNGTVSRLHLKVSLVGWQVEVSDLGSANGSVLQLPGEERELAPFEPVVIEPGARIDIGHRSMQYVVDQGA